MKRQPQVLVTSLVVGFFASFSARLYGAEVPLEKILVGVPEVSVTQSPLFVAIDAGAFKKYGMEVSVVRLPGAQAIQALVAGATQFAQGVSSRTVPSAVLAGADTVMIAGITNKFIFTMHSLPNIDSVASLKGKIVGVSGIGASIDFATRVALKHFGLKPDADVAIRAIGGGPEIVSALKAGIIQAGTLSPPSSFRAEKMGFKRLFDMGTLDKTFQWFNRCAPFKTFQEFKNRVDLHVLRIIKTSKRLPSRMRCVADVKDQGASLKSSRSRKMNFHVSRILETSKCPEHAVRGGDVRTLLTSWTKSYRR
jgi:ABC-type nitrate/sulfonate/bicarbonate transport system substrate-binding protein